MYNIRLLAAELYGDHHMTQIENWPRIAVVGAGAVGGYFGGLLVRAGARAIMLGRPTFVDAVNKDGLFLTLCNFRKTSACRQPTELSATASAEIIALFKCRRANIKKGHSILNGPLFVG
jgi:tRNA A37 threonylcarbamoyladenosine dehydratase